VHRPDLQRAKVRDSAPALPSSPSPVSSSTQTPQRPLPKPRPSPLTVPDGGVACTSNEFLARRMIEAFRMGVVPQDCIGQFIFGRQAEIATMNGWLSSGDQRLSFVVGEYGTGKTHFLEWIARRALAQGYLVSRVNTDPAGTPFHKPKRIWCEIASSLQYAPGWQDNDLSARGFRDLVRDLCRRGRLYDHALFSHVADHAENELVWDWIEGKESVVRPWVSDEYWYSQLPGLYPFSTAVNQYTNLMSGLGWAAHEALGMAGLLVIIDEAESVASVDYTYQLGKGLNTLEAILRLATDDQELGSTVDDLRRSGLDYCRVGRPIPFVYRYPARTKVVVAFTEQVFDNGMQGVTDVELTPLDDAALGAACAEICTRYAVAYGVHPSRIDPTSILSRVRGSSGMTRMFVKACVEALDIARFGSDTRVTRKPR